MPSPEPVPPTPRIDAVQKVTGATHYASDSAGDDDLHAVPVLVDEARGTLTEIETKEARAAAGVRAVLTHRELGTTIAPGTFLYDGGHFHSSFAPMAGPEIRYHGQLVALVVADTLEQAGHAASLITWSIDPAPAVVDLAEAERIHDQEIFTHASRPDAPGGGESAQPAERHTVDAAYATAALLHQPLEPYATRAAWHSGRLVVETPSQWVVGEARGLAQALNVHDSAVRVVSTAVGGAFGSRVLLLWHTVYVAEAARRLGRPVRLHVARGQMATLGSFRAATEQRVHLECSSEGRLVSYNHEVRSQTSRSDIVPLPGTSLTTRLYDVPFQQHRETVAPSDLPTPGFMRAPLEYPVAFALESALDELAIAVGIDPVEMRLRNLHTGPAAYEHGTHHLVRCLREGADRFGWADRDPRVGGMHEAGTGEVLGWGVAVAHYPGYRGGLTRARVRVDPDGTVIVQLAAHDPGTGLGSAVAVAVASMLGVAIDRVAVQLGDSDLPLAPMAAGSASTATAVRAATQAAATLLDRYGQGLVQAPPAAGICVEVTTVPEGYREGQAARALEGHFVQSGPETDSGFTFSVGAHFVEVGVSAARGHVRVRRMLGVFDVGTVLHPVALRGQLEGGMLWGASHALMEDARIDAGVGRFLATGLVDYHLLSHADTPELAVHVLQDDAGSDTPKGAGELGVVGSSAAITNAIYHATGKRIRSLPLRPEALLDPAPVTSDRVVYGNR